MASPESDCDQNEFPTSPAPSRCGGVQRRVSREQISFFVAVIFNFGVAGVLFFVLLFWLFRFLVAAPGWVFLVSQMTVDRLGAGGTHLTSVVLVSAAYRFRVSVFDTAARAVCPSQPGNLAFSARRLSWCGRKGHLLADAGPTSTRPRTSTDWQRKAWSSPLAMPVPAIARPAAPA